MPGAFYNGDITEIIVYPRALTSTERTQVESHLMAARRPNYHGKRMRRWN
jgi:hypothetical protein